jgi:hypothetical protein
MNTMNIKIYKGRILVRNGKIALGQACCCPEDSVDTPCCDFPVPRTLHVAYSNPSAGCPELDGATAEITYDDDMDYWVGNMVLDGYTIRITFHCDYHPDYPYYWKYYTGCFYGDGQEGGGPLRNHDPFLWKQRQYIHCHPCAYDSLADVTITP